VWFFEFLANKQTNKQTDRQTDKHKPFIYMKIVFLVMSSVHTVTRTGTLV